MQISTCWLLILTRLVITDDCHHNDYAGVATLCVCGQQGTHNLYVLLLHVGFAYSTKRQSRE